jgi:phosphatidylinositol alpha-1,6-mannosyltransferase
VLTALRLLRDRSGLPRFSIAVAGADADPSYREMLDREVAEHELREMVLFVGHLPPEELRAAYLDADIGVLASEFEGRPRAVLEMGAMGLPVVAADADGTRETLRPGRSGHLVEIGRPGQLAEAIADLLTKPERRAEFGHAGAVFVREHHSLDQLAARHVSFYLDILRGAHGHGSRPS